MEFLKKIFERLGGLNSKVIHIAGSKGKGTSAYLLAEALNAAGYKVGLFTSPPIFCYEEMICVNMKPVPARVLKENIKSVREACGEKKISVFEEVTLAAFLYFRNEKCDYVVLETGVGGRMDSTNIVDRKVLTILTHVELEHTDLLGDSLDKIAREKLGICRKGVPLLTPANQHKSVLDEIEKEGIDYKLCSSFELGNHHPEACGLSIFALDLLGIPVDKKIHDRMVKLKIPGHFEVKKFGIHTLILDGAHTFDSIQSLHEKVLNYMRKESLSDPVWIFHILKDKPREITQLFLKKNSIWMEIKNERSGEVPENFSHASAKEIFEDIKKEKNRRLYVFTGSFRVVAAAKAELGEKPSECHFV